MQYKLKTFGTLAAITTAFASVFLPVVARAQTPVGELGYSYCVVLNDTSRKVFASTIFERNKGAQQGTDGAAFAAEKSLDQRGTYDPEPPKLRMSCNWDATMEQAKQRLRNTQDQARKNNLNFLGLSWSPKA